MATDNNDNDATFECIHGNALARTNCILTYAGSTQDIILNYFLLLINLIYCTVLLVQQPSTRHDRTKQLQHYALGALIFVVIFQVGLCLMLGCSGISIVWCAMGGWSMSERRRWQNESFSKFWPSLVILVDTTAIVYYAIIMEPITTVAHICALVLGAMLSLVSKRRYDGDLVDPADEASARQPLVGTST